MQGISDELKDSVAQVGDLQSSWTGTNFSNSTPCMSAWGVATTLWKCRMQHNIQSGNDSTFLELTHPRWGNGILALQACCFVHQEVIRTSAVFEERLRQESGEHALFALLRISLC